MLQVKQYLLLCELAESAETRLEYESFAELELLEQSSIEHRRDWVLLLNKEQQYGIVVVLQPKESGNQITYSFPLDTMVHNIREELPPDVTTVFTGLGQGGWRAAMLAETLDAEAIVFGAPTIEELPGKAFNYVGENDPVGDHTEKVVFVKEMDDLEEEDVVPLSRKLVFDDSGRVILSEQSEFSRFVSWFYNTAGTVEPVIWNFFFPGTEEDEATVLADLGVYSVFLKVGELNNERVLRSVSDIIRYTAGKLEFNRKQLAAELDKLADDDYDNQVSEITRKYAKLAEEFVMHTFQSVQTVFMGVALFTMEQASMDTDTLIDNFHRQIHDILDQELECVIDCLDQAIARRLDRFFQLPSFNF